MCNKSCDTDAKGKFPLSFCYLFAIQIDSFIYSFVQKIFVDFSWPESSWANASWCPTEYFMRFLFNFYIESFSFSVLKIELNWILEIGIETLWCPIIGDFYICLLFCLPIRMVITFHLLQSLPNSWQLSQNKFVKNNISFDGMMEER